MLCFKSFHVLWPTYDLWFPVSKDPGTFKLGKLTADPRGVARISRKITRAAPQDVSDYLDPFCAHCFGEEGQVSCRFFLRDAPLRLFRDICKSHGIRMPALCDPSRPSNQQLEAVGRVGNLMLLHQWSVEVINSAPQAWVRDGLTQMIRLAKGFRLMHPGDYLVREHPMPVDAARCGLRFNSCPRKEVRRMFSPEVLTEIPEEARDWLMIWLPRDVFGREGQGRCDSASCAANTVAFEAMCRDIVQRVWHTSRLREPDCAWINLARRIRAALSKREMWIVTTPFHRPTHPVLSVIGGMLVKHVFLGRIPWCGLDADPADGPGLMETRIAGDRMLFLTDPAQDEAEASLARMNPRERWA